jgi:outer membrane lipoprotein-sorting protein
MNIIKKAGVFAVFIYFFVLLVPGWAQQKENNYKDILLKMKERFERIETYRCVFESFTAKGEKTKKVVSRYFFKAPKMVRMEIREGKYKGAVMLYKPHKVRLKLGKGILSLISFSFKPGHDWVTDLRDYGLHQSDWGWYINRHIQMLKYSRGRFAGQEAAAGRKTDKYIIISKEPDHTSGVAKEMLWIDKKECIPVKYVQYNSVGKIIMSSLYKEIELNVDLEDRLFTKFR